MKARILIIVLLFLATLRGFAAVRSVGTLGSGTESGTVGLPAAPVPAGVVADDIIVMLVTQDNSAANFIQSSWPGGFTMIVNSALTADGQRVGVAWKRATGADSGTYQMTGLSSSGAWLARAIAFSGRDTTNPPVMSTLTTNNSANTSPVTITANGVTALSGDDLLWVGLPDNTVTNNFSSFTDPTGYTNRMANGSGFCILLASTKENVSAGATGSIAGTMTLSSGGAGWTSTLISIPSSGGGGPTPHGCIMGGGLICN